MQGEERLVPLVMSSYYYAVLLLGLLLLEVCSPLISLANPLLADVRVSLEVACRTICRPGSRAKCS
jgi:hypothetical protein